MITSSEPASPARTTPGAHPDTRLQEGQYESTVPVIADRCHQARVRNALEPEWEARFEPKSYGFRPGRGCQDAVKAIHTSCKGSHAKRVWALDADLAAAFDRIDHTRLLGAIGDFPGRGMIAGWLKAGVFEPEKGLLRPRRELRRAILLS